MRKRESTVPGARSEQYLDELRGWACRTHAMSCLGRVRFGLRLMLFGPTAVRAMLCHAIWISVWIHTPQSDLVRMHRVCLQKLWSSSRGCSGDVVFVKAATSAMASNSSQRCPCLNYHPAGVNISSGSILAFVAGASYAYPPRYGLDRCAPHDSDLPPHCDALGRPRAAAGIAGCEAWSRPDDLWDTTCCSRC